MPDPGVPPKLLPTMAMVLPSAEVFTRYQASNTGAGVAVVPMSTVSSLKVTPASVEMRTCGSCDTATITEPSAELSTERQPMGRVTPAGSVAAVQVAPELLLIRRSPPWLTAATRWPFCDTVTDSKL